MIHFRYKAEEHGELDVNDESLRTLRSGAAAGTFGPASVPQITTF